MSADTEAESLAESILEHLTRYASFWVAVRYALEHAESLDEDRLTEAEVAYLVNLRGDDR